MPGYLVRSAHPRAPLARRAEGTGAGETDAGASGRHFENVLFEDWRDHRVLLEIVCFDQLVLEGYLRAWERYSLLVETTEGATLVMKHGVIRIRPRPARPATRRAPGAPGAPPAAG